MKSCSSFDLIRFRTVLNVEPLNMSVEECVAEIGPEHLHIPQKAGNLFAKMTKPNSGEAMAAKVVDWCSSRQPMLGFMGDFENDLVDEFHASADIGRDLAVAESPDNGTVAEAEPIRDTVSEAEEYAAYFADEESFSYV